MGVCKIWPFDGNMMIKHGMQQGSRFPDKPVVKQLALYHALDNYCTAYVKPDTEIRSDLDDRPNSTNPFLA